MNIYQRLKEETPRTPKVVSRIALLVGTVVGGLLTTGLITDPKHILLLTAISSLCGALAVYTGQKMVIKPESPEDETK